jgi:hypothetical protein
LAFDSFAHWECPPGSSFTHARQRSLNETQVGLGWDEPVQFYMSFNDNISSPRTHGSCRVLGKEASRVLSVALRPRTHGLPPHVQCHHNAETGFFHNPDLYRLLCVCGTLAPIAHTSEQCATNEVERYTRRVSEVY